jgi:hypothetical protein
MEIIKTTDLQSMGALEDCVRSKLFNDEASPQDDASIPSGDAISLQKAMREMRSRYEVSKTCMSNLDLPDDAIGNRLTSSSYGSA